MNLKDKKYLLIDLDGVCYGSHNGYPLEKVFGMVSKRMTLFIQNKLDLSETEAKELQTNYFYKYNTSLNGLMLHHNVVGDEFLEFVRGKKIIIHNASFDLGFLNGELNSINKKELIEKDLLLTHSR